MTIKEMLSKIQNDINIIISTLDKITQSLNNDTKISKPSMSAHDNALVMALLECVSIQQDLESIKADLPIEISSRINDNDNELVQVRQLVRVCNSYGVIQMLIDTVALYEGDSLAFIEVKKLLGIN